MGPRLVSVVVPTYNAAAFLDEFCCSLHAQTHPDFEALFFNDGSTDDTEQVLARHKSDPRFKIFSSSRNLGPTSATRELLLKIEGAFWCNPGADDILEPSFIEQRLRVVRERPDAVIVHGPGAVIDRCGKLLPGLPYPTNIPATLRSLRALEVLLEHNIINTPSVFVRSSITKAVIPRFSGNWRYAQDWFLWILHLAAGGSLVWSDERLHRYRVHSTSLTLNPNGEANRQAEIRLVPLCALAAASALSHPAMELWRHWRTPLYALWLRRALKLHRRGLLQSSWMDTAATAYYGVNRERVALSAELCRHFAAIVRTSIHEFRLRRAIKFPIAGLALIDDPLFR